MNLNLLGYGPEHDRQWIMIDLGVTFGDQRTPGIDVIMPDPEFILEYRQNILGLVLTHGGYRVDVADYIFPKIAEILAYEE